MRILVLLLIAVMIMSCGNAPRIEFVDAVYAYSLVAFTQHKKYIEEDKTLTKEDREVRINATDEIFRLVEEEHERQSEFEK